MKSVYERGLRHHYPHHWIWLILTVLISIPTMLYTSLCTVPTFLSAYASRALSSPAPHQRCKAGDGCWPSSAQWETFNATINGQLIPTYPSAAVCHTDHYSKDSCSIARGNWTDSFWRTSQPGAYSAILWELGADQCFVNTTVGAPCGQGRVAQYSVNASGVVDVQTAIRFASERNLYLVVKNTGHDHLGRSGGAGSFAIWTHNLKGRHWHDEFVPKGAPEKTEGVSAVTLQAGEQWLDVYKDAAAHNLTVVGGSARTVGAAGVGLSTYHVSQY
jgi:hypothetical protein